MKYIKTIHTNSLAEHDKIIKFLYNQVSSSKDMIYYFLESTFLNVLRIINNYVRMVSVREIVDYINYYRLIIFSKKKV